ncbi:MAG: LamG-like jellyroll fold domain-containing protein, partial [Verrucomicrobiota bacterium]
YFNILDEDALGFGDRDFTISAWVSTHAEDERMLALKRFSASNTNEPSWRWLMESNVLTFAMTGVGELTATSLVAHSGYHLLTFTQTRNESGDEEAWRMYVDGNLVASKTAGETIEDPASMTDLRFGDLNGFVDHVRFGKTAWSADWIATYWSNVIHNQSFFTYGEPVYLGDLPVVSHGPGATEGTFSNVTLNANLLWDNGLATDVYIEWGVSGTTPTTNWFLNVTSGLHSVTVSVTNDTFYSYAVGAINNNGEDEYGITVEFQHVGQ